MQPWTIDAWLAFGRLVVDTAWPIVAVVIVLVFRRELRDIFPRLRKLPGQIELADAHQQPVDLPDPGATPEAVFAVWAPVRETIRAQIAAQTAGMTQASALEWLSGNLLLARRTVAHMLVLRHIFGSQIELLNRCVAIGGTLADEAIKDIHAIHVTRQGPMPVARWLNYLRQHGLITGDERLVTITDLGRDLVLFNGLIGETSESRSF